MGRLKDLLVNGAVWISLVCMGGMTLFYINQSSTDRRVAADHTAIVAQHVTSTQLTHSYILGCQRLVVLSNALNNSEYADYLLFKGAIDGVQKAHHALPVHNVLTSALNAQTWIPQANCAQTVAREGAHYRLPTAVPFTTRLPPKSALKPPVFR